MHIVISGAHMHDIDIDFGFGMLFEKVIINLIETSKEIITNSKTL